MQDHPTRFIGRLAPVAIGASLMVAGAIFAAADRPPSLFGVDAPELAPLGAYSVGVRTLHLVQQAQVDVSAFDAVRGTAPERDRALNVDLWYPARTGARAKRETYTAVLPG